MANILEEIRAKAQKNKKHILLPDGTDERSIQAARIIVDEGIATITLLGSETAIREKADKLNIKLNGIFIIDPEKHSKLQDFANQYYNARKAKGKEIKIEEATKTVKSPVFFAAMFVKDGLADGSVAGSLSTTGDVIRAGILGIGTAAGISVVSSFFLMVLPDGRLFAFADCSVVPNPDAKQLADIAISTADNFKKITGLQPKVGMLSFSTKGSAKHELVDKVIEATKIAQTKRPDLLIDGEVQLDSAIVPKVSAQKCPGSKIGGEANVLVFPDLNAGNIGYKLVQRLAKAEAVGPVVQGLSRPFFDLSRGCSVDDIVNTVAINSVMGAA
jgi:phosphate acetyltransferase